MRIRHRIKRSLKLEQIYASSCFHWQGSPLVYNRPDLDTRESFTEFSGIYANARLQLHRRLLTNIRIIEPVI